MKANHSVVKIGHPVTLRVENSIDVCAIDQSTLEIRPRWVSVEEQLPEENIRVLVLSNKGCIDIDQITHPKDMNLWSCISRDSVSHWMPLPTPPSHG